MSLFKAFARRHDNKHNVKCNAWNTLQFMVAIYLVIPPCYVHICFTSYVCMFYFLFFIIKTIIIQLPRSQRRCRDRQPIRTELKWYFSFTTMCEKKSQLNIFIDIYENIDAPSPEAGPSLLEHEVWMVLLFWWNLPVWQFKLSKLKFSALFFWSTGDS